MIESYKAPFPPHIDKLMKQLKSKKRSCYVTVDVDCNPRTLYSYWDGGSRDLYYVVRNGNVFVPPVNRPFGNAAEAYIPHVGDVLVQYGTFQGKESYPHFTFFGVQE